MQWKIVALVFMILLSGMQAAVAEKFAVKAATPVEVSIYPVTPVYRGQASTFVVRAVSSLPSEDFSIEIIPSEGSEVLSGDLVWQGPMMPGVPRELSITLRLSSDSVPTVSVNSSIHLDGEVRFAASATYSQQVQTPAAYKAVSKERKVPRKGHQVIEYRVK
jgi:hypothetical protein